MHHGRTNVRYRGGGRAHLSSSTNKVVTCWYHVVGIRLPLAYVGLKKPKICCSLAASDSIM